MKKLISAALALVFLLGIPAVSSTAVTIPYIYMRPIVNSEKTTLTVEIYTNGLRWTAFDGGIQFDPSALTLVSVNEGSKIATAKGRGYDFITDHREISSANAAGYCNFVAVTGATDCKMTNYAGPVAVYTFAVKDLAKAKTGYDLCVNTLTNSAGTPLVSYTPFPLESPTVHIANGNNPFVYGDLTRDGIDVYDAMLVLQYVVGTTTLEEYQKYAARVSGESEISIYDAMLILQRVVGVVTTFPVEG